MIHTNELMIGNYLQDKKGRLCKVEGIKTDSFYAYPIEGAISTLPYEAIPLTPELLERCGFVKEFDNRQDTWIFMQSIEGSNIIVQHYKNGEYIFIWELNFIGKPIEYLHTLMNLIKTLTGKELKIK